MGFPPSSHPGDYSAAWTEGRVAAWFSWRSARRHLFSLFYRWRNGGSELGSRWVEPTQLNSEGSTLHEACPL